MSRLIWAFLFVLGGVFGSIWPIQHMPQASVQETVVPDALGADLYGYFSTASQLVPPGRTVGYVMRFGNHGPAVATNVTTLIELPPEVVDVIPPQPEGMTCSVLQAHDKATRWVCALETLSPNVGEYAIAVGGHLRADATVGSIHSVYFHVQSTVVDPDRTNNMPGAALLVQYLPGGSP